MQRRRWSWREAALWLLIVTDEDLTTRPWVEWGIHKTTCNEAESNGTRHVISSHVMTVFTLKSCRFRVPVANQHPTNQNN